MISMKMVNKDPNWREMIRVEMNINNSSGVAVRAVADALAADIRSNWSSTSPSAVGSAPAVVTGNLDSSVQVDPQGRDTSGRFASEAKVMFVRVDTSMGDNPDGRGNYSVALEEQLDRPFTQPAIDRMQSMAPAIFKRIIKP